MAEDAALKNPLLLLTNQDADERKLSGDQPGEPCLIGSGVMDALFDVVLISDLAGHLAYVNQSAILKLGYNREELLKKRIFDLVTSDSREVFRGILAAVASDPGAGGPVRFLHKNGYGVNLEVKGHLYVCHGMKKFMIVGRDLSPAAMDGPPGVSGGGISLDSNELKGFQAPLGDNVAACLDAERQFQTIFENSTEGILIADPESKQFQFCNPMMARMLGYTQDEVQRLGVSDIHPKASLTYVLEQFDLQARGVITVAPDMPVLRQDGSVFYADISSSHIIIRGKLYVMGIFRDVTARKQAQEALRISETNYRTLVEQSQALILRLTPQGTITFANQFAQKFSGYVQAEIVGRHIIGTILPAEDSKGFSLADKVKEILHDPRRHWSSWTEAVRQDGTKRWLEWNFGAFYDQTDKQTEILCVGIDRTERKQAEMTLQLFSQILEEQVERRTAEVEAIKNRLQYIIQTTPAIILTANLAAPHHLTFVSDHARHLGGNPCDLLGAPLFDLGRVHPDDHLQVTLALEALHQDRQVTVQFRLAKKDGSYCWFQANARVETNEQGEPVEIVACWIDLTRQKELEQNLEILSGPSMRLKVWKKSSQVLQDLNPTLLPQSWTLLQECLQAALSGGTITGVTLKLQGKNGQSLQGFLTAGPVKEPRGADHKAVGVVIELRHEKSGLH